MHPFLPSVSQLPDPFRLVPVTTQSGTPPLEGMILRVQSSFGTRTPVTYRCQNPSRTNTRFFQLNGETVKGSLVDIGGLEVLVRGTVRVP